MEWQFFRCLVFAHRRMKYLGNQCWDYSDRAGGHGAQSNSKGQGMTKFPPPPPHSRTGQHRSTLKTVWKMSGKFRTPPSGADQAVSHDLRTPLTAPRHSRFSTEKGRAEDYPAYIQKCSGNRRDQEPSIKCLSMLLYLENTGEIHHADLNPSMFAEMVKRNGRRTVCSGDSGFF